MTRTIRCFKSVAARLLCGAFMLGLPTMCFGQPALPVLHPIHVRNFTIPFELGDGANPHGDVELFVSQDRGKRWHIVARQPVGAGKFAFRADADGEYWFAFRRVPTAGNHAPNAQQYIGQPSLRVLVHTTESSIATPSQPSEPKPITPPKPERFRPEDRGNHRPKQQHEQTITEQTTSTESENIEPVAEVHQPEPQQQFRPAFGPKLPGFEPAEAARRHESDLLEDLMTGMRPFMDVQPVTIQRNMPQRNMPSPASLSHPSSGGPGLASLQPLTAVPPSAVPPSAVQSLTTMSAESPAGNITNIDLIDNAARPKVLVQWNQGNESWRDAQIDILRSNTGTGPWIPIAINLQNSGEYWWFLTPEDLNPFFVAVRVRSLTGGIHLNATQSPIDVSSRLAQTQR